MNAVDNLISRFLSRFGATKPSKDLEDFEDHSDQAFLPFPRLPQELQLKIWEHAVVEPRILSVSNYGYGSTAPPERLKLRRQQHQLHLMPFFSIYPMSQTYHVSRQVSRISIWMLIGVKQNEGVSGSFGPGIAVPRWGILKKTSYYWLNFDGHKDIFFDGGRLGYGSSDNRSKSTWLRKCQVKYLALDTRIFCESGGSCWDMISDTDCLEELIMALIPRCKECAESKKGWCSWMWIRSL
ncbi:uncharacterized protein PAC_13719 [Phialocephala subalpina]|uniref:2EXR domain-containing protein n=1 Tax=Phialocephala subalpina TaxID=576137 RepID=A0A1L7XFL6_9HELO|nr:uncharacterized protein PAC_13719 [Phialocephala subalpina]